jgi:hypothetical protein
MDLLHSIVRHIHWQKDLDKIQIQLLETGGWDVERVL